MKRHTSIRASGVPIVAAIFLALHCVGAVRAAEPAEHRKSALVAVEAYEAAMKTLPHADGNHRHLSAARDIIAALVADPTKESLEDWVLLARLSVASPGHYADGALSYVVIRGLKPDFAADSTLKTLMDELARRWPTDQQEAVAKARAEFLAEFDRVSKGVGSRLKLGDAYRAGAGIVRNPTAAVRQYQAGAEAGDWQSMMKLSECLDQGSGIARDEKAAASWVIKAAEKGDVATWRALASRYESGYGLAEEPAKAIALYEKAAAAGDVRSMIALAERFNDGEKSNSPKMKRWYEKAIEAQLKNPDLKAEATQTMRALAFNLLGEEGADEATKKDGLIWIEKAQSLGDEEAAWQLAIVHHEGRFVPRDVAKAEQWLETFASTKGKFVGERAGRIAEAYRDDYEEELPLDLTKARAWFARAAEAGHTQSMISLGSMLARGQGGAADAAASKVWLEKAAAADEEGHQLQAIGQALLSDEADDGGHAQAIAWFEKAAAKNNISAMFWLGRHHASGQSGKKDSAKAQEWFERIAQSKGGYSRLTSIARIYGSPDDPAHDDEMANAWYRRAVAIGINDAAMQLAKRLEAGKGSPKDSKQAMELFEKRLTNSYSQGDALNAIQEIIEFYTDGDMIEADRAKELHWLGRAAAMGDQESMIQLGFRLSAGSDAENDEAAAEEWFAKAVALDPQASIRIAHAFTQGEEVARNQAKGFAWYIKAAQTDDLSTMYFVGHRMAYGNYLERNEREGFKWILKAAQSGHPEAMREVGWMYGRGKGTPRDDEKGIEWLRKGSQAGDTFAMVWLGVYHEDGRAVKRDLAQALTHYMAAAEKGNTWAMLNVGRFHLYARGVPQDKAEARRWFEKAREAGDRNAQGWINLIPK